MHTQREMGGERRSDAGDGRLHVAMFPFLAFGHIVPFVELSKKLAAHGARVSFLSAPANIPRITSLLSPSQVDVIALELPPVEGLPPEIQSTAEATPAMAELLTKAVDLTKPRVEALLAELRPHAIFHDFAQPWLPSVAHPLGVKTVFFSVFAAVSSAFLTVPARRLSPDASPSVEDLRSPPPGFPSPPVSCIDAVPLYQAADFSYIFKSFDSRPCVFDRVVSCMSASSAIAIKTCREMEAPYVDYVVAQYRKPVLLAGPVVPEPPEGELEARWANWLDSFPAGSVIYCSFGSETCLTDEGIRELALGLELTGLPFFLVLNFRKGGSGDGQDAAETLRKKLPEGFAERVRGKGVVHSGWVQQRQILAHPAVGCFLCHAGLSSVVEAVISGCQLVLLPQRGDQFLNARLFSGDLRAAVEVRRRDEDGGFAREDVREAVKMVMVGEEKGEKPGRSALREKNRWWREFLLDPVVHRGFTAEFVDKLKEMAGCR